MHGRQQAGRTCEQAGTELLPASSREGWSSSPTLQVKQLKRPILIAQYPTATASTWGLLLCRGLGRKKSTATVDFRSLTALDTPSNSKRTHAHSPTVVTSSRWRKHRRLVMAQDCSSQRPFRWSCKPLLPVLAHPAASMHTLPACALSTWQPCFCRDCSVKMLLMKLQKHGCCLQLPTVLELKQCLHHGTSSGTAALSPFGPLWSFNTAPLGTQCSLPASTAPGRWKHGTQAVTLPLA